MQNIQEPIKENREIPLKRNDISILIGGKAGFGIDKAGSIIAGLLNRLGYYIYVYREYPSLIRGGHTYSLIRASERKICCHNEQIDFLLALNQDTVDLHKGRLKNNASVVYDASVAQSSGQGIAVAGILQEEGAAEVMRNSCIIGGFCKAAGIPWEILEDVFKKKIDKEFDLNLKVALRGFGAVERQVTIPELSSRKVPVITGNEAVGLGLLKGGLRNFVAYPMTPTSGILHFLASLAEDGGIKVIHPESEISVILMALGFAYTGEKTAVSTSGGGFCLMTEGLSLAGMAELPVVIVVGQRPGPSTGLPTYTSQTELNFVLHAGQGEFPRFIAAPGDTEEAYYWSAVALQLAWKYQIPAIVLVDKTLAEGAFSFDMQSVPPILKELLPLWDRDLPYKRYFNSETGVSPLAFAPEKGTVIKVNSYEHDESGITIEDAGISSLMQAKRLRKETHLAEELKAYETVKVYGDPKASRVLLCWGSNKGACCEVAQLLSLKVVQVVVMSPFPLKEIKQSLRQAKEVICVENNATGQLSSLMSRYGISVKKRVLKSDGRPFSVDELKERVEKELL
ncbi:MAG: 2-oxoacid:acceptor oxidoreductase subunit alpha [Candidatus Omnitrophota bacterium]|jgi:2-oxoglutarate ferredoxin oxidoreductase subunit alpha